nr:unnamed protein product [Callosobruchus chinensis]
MQTITKCHRRLKVSVNMYIDIFEHPLFVKFLTTAVGLADQFIEEVFFSKLFIVPADSSPMRPLCCNLGKSSSFQNRSRSSES